MLIAVVFFSCLMKKVFCLCTPVTKFAWNLGHICHCGASFFEDVPLVEFMYHVFTRMPGESYRRRIRSLLLSLYYVLRALVNSLLC